ncbi:hypothetical protein D3C78_711420 [compost metagenome]
MHFDAAAVEVGVEQAEAFGLVLHLFQRRGARQDQHLLGDAGGGDEGLHAAQHIVVAIAHGAGLELGGVEAGVRLGDHEAGAVLAGDQRRQHAVLLLFSTEDHDRVEAEDVHVHRRSTAHAGAGFGDGLHHHGRFGDTEARAAVGFRNADAQPAVLCQGLVEFDGEAAGLVLFQPVVGVEALADLQDRFADLAMLRGQVGCCGCDLAHAVFFRCLAAALYGRLKVLGQSDAARASRSRSFCCCWSSRQSVLPDAVLGRLSTNSTRRGTL